MFPQAEWKPVRECKRIREIIVTGKQHENGISDSTDEKRPDDRRYDQYGRGMTGYKINQGGATDKVGKDQHKGYCGNDQALHAFTIRP